MICVKIMWFDRDNETGDPIYDNPRYKEFIELMMDLRFDHVNAELDMTTLSNITQDIYRYPFTRWELKIPKDASSRWKTAYERMYQIADKLNKILIAKGF